MLLWKILLVSFEEFQTVLLSYSVDLQNKIQEQLSLASLINNQEIVEGDIQLIQILNENEETILLKKKPGDTVNLECDLIGKYVEKLLFGKAEETQKSSGGITEAFLAENGFM